MSRQFCPCVLYGVRDALYVGEIPFAFEFEPFLETKHERPISYFHFLIALIICWAYGVNTMIGIRKCKQFAIFGLSLSAAVLEFMTPYWLQAIKVPEHTPAVASAPSRSPKLTSCPCSDPCSIISLGLN